MKRNRLYTVNKWNKPAFMPEKNLFAFGDFLKEDSKNYMGNWLGAKDIKAPVGGLIGAAGTAVGSLANNLISNGFTSGAGNGIANIGGAVGSAVSNVNPILGGIISAGTGAIGGGVNALWGMKTDKEALERANSSISALNNFSSNAESFDDIRGPQAVAGIGDVYKGGVFKKGDARKKNEELSNNLANAMAFAENSVENNIYNISQNQLNDALANYSAYGGPLGFGEGALGLMQQNRYFDTIDKRTEAISKSNSYSMPTAYTGARTFDDGGLMPFLEGFGSDPIGAAVRYNRDVEQRRAAQEAAKEQAAREAEYTAMQQRLANLETRNSGLEAMLTAGAFTPTPSTLPIEASITPSEAAPTVASTTRRAGKGTRLSGNQWAQEHLNRWHDFLLKKGVNDADATRLSSFFTAQDGLESAGGTSAAAREKNNFGGMQKNGKNITYASPEDYMEDKWKMMNNRFKSALSAQDIDEYATILGNPNYGGKGYLYYVTDKVKLDPNNPEWIKAQTQHMNNYINGMRAWSKKAFGGELGTNGTDFTNGLLEINAGGSHQSNPLEGVPLGVDAEGIPNLVEEGETVYNDYVFSDRMMVPDFMYKELGLGGALTVSKHGKQKGVSFADASKKLAQESEQRPNDPISKAGLDASLSRLAEVQEAERMRKQAEEYMGLQQYACGGKMKKYAHGGKKGNLYDGEGDISQWLQGDLPSWEDLTRGDVVKDIDGNIISVPSNFYNQVAARPDQMSILTFLDPVELIGMAEKDFRIRGIMKNKGLSYGDAKREYELEQSRMSMGVAPTPGFRGSKGFRISPVNQRTGTFNLSRQAAMPRSTTPMPRGNTNAAPATTATRNYVNEAQAAADAQALRTGQQWAANGNRQSTATTERIVEGGNVGGGRFTERTSTTRRLNPRPTGEAVTGRGSTAEYDAVYDNLAGTIGARNPKTKGLFPVLVAGVGGASAWGLAASNEQRKKENLENFYNEHPNLRPTIPSVMETINGTTTTTQQEGSATTNTEQQPTATTPTTSNRNSFALFGNLARAAADAARQGGTPAPTSTYGQPRRGNTSWTAPLSLERVEGVPITGVGDSGLSYQIDGMDRRIRETDDRITAQTRALRTGNGEEERIPTYDTRMRYIPAVGSGIMALTDALGITNKPDYTYANKLEAAANAAGYAPNIQYEPIGNYLKYTPLDRQYYINQLMANSRATDRALSNTSAPSRAASTLANGYNTTLSLGNLARQAEEYNLAQREKVEDFNRKTNMFNSQMGLEAAMANARYRQQASQMGLSGLAQAAALRDSIDQRVGASRSANITNFLNNIGNIGRENMAFNMVNATNVANNGYWIDRKGRIHYVRRPKD